MIHDELILTAALIMHHSVQFEDKRVKHIINIPQPGIRARYTERIAIFSVGGIDNEDNNMAENILLNSIENTATESLNSMRSDPSNVSLQRRKDHGEME